jgi:hypothetical protein
MGLVTCLALYVGCRLLLDYEGGCTCAVISADRYTGETWIIIWGKMGTAVGDCLEGVFDLVESAIWGEDGDVSVVGCVCSSAHLFLSGEEG